MAALFCRHCRRRAAKQRKESIQSLTPLSLSTMSVSHRQLQHSPQHRTHMSRYGTPASELGRLAIGGSSTSSSGDMPVTTRAMRRGQASGGSASQPSSRTVAGPSRNAGRSSGRHRGAQGGRRQAGNGGSDDSDDDGGSSDGSDEDDAERQLRRQIMMAAFETAAALDQQLLSPRELMAANAQG